MAQTLSAQTSYDTTNVYYRIPYSSTTSWIRAYLDTDRNAATGYRVGTVGATYLIENGSLYRYTGTGTNWAWSYVKAVGFAKSNGIATITAARADLGSTAGLDLIANTDPPSLTSAKITQTFAASAPSATSDATNVYYKIPFSGTPTWVRVFLDTDRNAGTGFSFGSIGASHLVENGNLYRYTGTGGSNWAWTFVKTVGYTLGTTSADIRIARADLGSPAGINLVTNTELPVQNSSVISQTLSSTAPAPAPAPAPTC